MKDLRQLVSAAANRQQQRADALHGSDNPQIVDTKMELLVSAKTLRYVVEAIDAPRPTAAYDLQILTK